MPRIVSLIVLTVILNSCNTKKIIYIADTYAKCKGASNQKCLQVKENKTDEWILFYETIEDFEYKKGYIYKIEVEITKVKNAPADGSSLHYKLLKIISKEKTKSTNIAPSIHGHWKIIKLINIDTLRKSPKLEIDLKNRKISGNAGCNRYGSSFTIDSNTLKFNYPVATKMYCNHMKIEDTFFDCLEKTTSYKIENGKLQFFNKEGNVLLTCEKME